MKGKDTREGKKRSKSEKEREREKIAQNHKSRWNRKFNCDGLLERGRLKKVNRK